MIVKVARMLFLAAVMGAIAPAAAIVASTPLQAALSADEQATLDVVTAAEAEGGAAAQVAAIMDSSLSGPQKALAVQWLIEGASTDEQVAALAAAVIEAAVAAAAAGQTGTVATLGTGLGQAYKALIGDGRASAAGQVMTAVENATSGEGASGGLSPQMAALFSSSFNEAAAGTSRSAADSASEDSIDQGQTDTTSPPSPS